MVLVVKKKPANAGDIKDMGSIPGLERSPRGGHGNLLQYSCLLDRGAWWTEEPGQRSLVVHRVTKSQTRLK